MSFISLQSFRSNSESDMSENCVVLDAKAYQNEGNRRLKNHNDVKGAIEAYTKAIILSKSNYLYYNNRAMAYLLLRDNEKAIADCNLSLDLCKNVKAYCRKASALGHQQKFDEGITQVLKALDIDPKDKESSQVLETLLKDKNITQTLEEEDDTPQGLANKKLNERLIQKRASDLCEEGKLYIKNNNFHAGIESFTKAITLCPTSYKYYNYRAIAHKINGDYKKALSDCDNSWTIHKNIDAYNLKGSILSKQKKFNEGLECIVSCLEIDPDHEESILLHEKISKSKQGRNRAQTMTFPTARNMNTNKNKMAKKGKLLQQISEKGELLKSPSKLMSKLSSPKNSDREEEVPWYDIPTRHTRSNESGTKHGSIRILDKFEWQDLPVEYARVGVVKSHDSRGATKAVRMKQIEKKMEVPTPIRSFFTNVYIIVVGAVQRSLSTDGTRRASVSPEIRRTRSRGSMTPVGV